MGFNSDFKGLNPDFQNIKLFKGKERFCTVWIKWSQREVKGGELRHKTEIAHVTWSSSFPHIIIY